IYGKNSPFATIQEYEHLDNITRADLSETYKMYFAPGNMLAGITGPVELEQVKAVFEKYLGNWAHQARIPAYPQVQEQTHDFKTAFAQKSSLSQSYFSIGHLGIKTDFSKSAKFRVFNSIFSGGMSSRLSIRVRVKMGLTYGIGGGIGTRYLYPGITEFNTFTKSESTIKAIKAMLDEIDIIRKEKVSETELKDAKEALLNAYVFEFSTPDKVLRNSLAREFYDIDPNIADRLMEDVKKVTAGDIMEIAQNYLHPEKLVILVVGNKEKLDGDLSQLGKVKELDISIKPPALKEKIPAATPQALEKGAQLITKLAKEQYKGYQRLKSLEKISNMKMTMMGRTMDMGMKAISLFPDKDFLEMSVMGMKIPTIINGKKGVTRAMGKSNHMSEEDIEKGRFGDLYNIFHSSDKYKFQYLDEKEIDGKKYDVVYVTGAKKMWVKFFINKETGFIEINERLTQMRGQTGVERTVKSDFKIIKGIPFAFKSKTFLKDKVVRESLVKEIKVNPKVDPAIFKIEEKK
ncbi:MAG: insulinase family protein, partial [bacterium]|nr:insulinase family protein [bacterium]